MHILQILRSSRMVVEMGVGMYLAAALFHFVSALVMNLVMPFLNGMLSAAETADTAVGKQHPAVMSVNWGNFLQASVELLLCLITGMLILRWAARPD